MSLIKFGIGCLAVNWALDVAMGAPSSQQSPPLLDGANVRIPLCSKPELWTSYEKEIQSKLGECSATKELEGIVSKIQTKHGLPPWRVKIVPFDSQFSDGAASFLTGEVRIRCNAKRPTATAAFELQNLKQQERIAKLWTDALKWNIEDRDIYAKNAEWIEYNGVTDHIAMMDTCIAERGWKDSVQIWDKKSWPEWWREGIFSDHCDWHRNQFDFCRLKAGETIKPDSGMIAKILDIVRTYFNPKAVLHY